MSVRQATHDDLRVEVLKSADALRAIAGDWDDLWRRSDVTMPTVRAEPTALWIETFAPNRRIRILTVRHADRLVGALPLAERKVGRFLSAGDLSLNHWSPNGELLLDHGADAAAVTEQLAAATEEIPWPLMWFAMVPYRAERWSALNEALVRSGAKIDLRPGFEIGRVSLDQSFDKHMASRSKNLRRSVRKDFTRLEWEGFVEVRVLDCLEPQQVEAVLRNAFELEDSGWKGEAGTSVLRSEGVFDFYRHQAEYFARQNMLRVAFLECAGRAIAFELGWIGKGVYHSFKVGYDERCRKFGPGHLLRYKLIEAGCADPNLRFVDFQGPINQALRAWSTETYAIGRLAVCPPRIASRTLWAGLRTARQVSRGVRRAAAWLP